MIDPYRTVVVAPARRRSRWWVWALVVVLAVGLGAGVGFFAPVGPSVAFGFAAPDLAGPASVEDLRALVVAPPSGGVVRSTRTMDTSDEAQRVSHSLPDAKSIAAVVQTGFRWAVVREWFQDKAPVSVRLSQYRTQAQAVARAGQLIGAARTEIGWQEWPVPTFPAALFVRDSVHGLRIRVVTVRGTVLVEADLQNGTRAMWSQLGPMLKKQYDWLPAPAGADPNVVGVVTAPADLRALVLPMPRGGTTIKPSETAADGVLTLLEAAEVFDDPSWAAQLLEEKTFLRGVSVAWMSGGSTVHIDLWEFSLSEYSESFVEQMAVYENDRSWTKTGSLPNVSKGYYWLQPSYGRVRAAKGRLYLRLTATGGAGTSVANLTKLAQDQLARLP